MDREWTFQQEHNGVQVVVAFALKISRLWNICVKCTCMCFVDKIHTTRNRHVVFTFWSNYPKTKHYVNLTNRRRYGTQSKHVIGENGKTFCFPSVYCIPASIYLLSVSKSSLELLSWTIHSAVSEVKPNTLLYYKANC